MSKPRSIPAPASDPEQQASSARRQSSAPPPVSAPRGGSYAPAIARTAPAADFAHWSRADTWTRGEAAALLLGAAPEWATFDKLSRQQRVSDVARKYCQVWDLIRRAQTAGLLDYPDMRPVEFIAWAKAKRIEHAPEIDELAVTAALDVGQVTAKAASPARDDAEERRRLAMVRDLQTRLAAIVTDEERGNFKTLGGLMADKRAISRKPGGDEVICSMEGQRPGEALWDTDGMRGAPRFMGWSARMLRDIASGNYERKRRP